MNETEYGVKKTPIVEKKKVKVLVDKKTNYSFVNQETKEVFSGTSKEFITKIQMNEDIQKEFFSKKVRYYKDWIINGFTI